MLVESVYKRAHQAYKEAKTWGMNSQPKVVRHLWGVTLSLGMALTPAAVANFSANTPRVIDLTGLDRAVYSNTINLPATLRPWRDGWRTVIDGGRAIRFYDKQVSGKQLSAYKQPLLPPPPRSDNTACVLKEIFSAFKEHQIPLTRTRAMRVYFRYLQTAREITSEGKRTEALYLAFLNAKF